MGRKYSLIAQPLLGIYIVKIEVKNSDINKRKIMIRGTVHFKIEICKGCELCIEACPQESLALSSKINLQGYRFAELVKDNCTGCENCAIVCPDAAITVYRQPKSAIKKAKKETAEVK